MRIVTHIRAVFVAGFAVLALVLPRSVGAEPRALPVVVAEVTSNASSTHLSNITELLRQDVESELSAIDWSRAKLRKRYKVSASIVDLETRPQGERSLISSCTVSAAVRDASKGTVLFIVQGRARVEDAKSAAASAERDALAGAVRGAIGRLPEAIAAAQ